MKKRARWLGIGVLLVLLIGPFLIPVNTSGTLTKEAAAAEIWGDRSEWVTLADHQVHFVTAGDPESNRLIVLLHGFGASAFSYRDVLEPLGEVGYVIAYDRAAFGFTERPTTWELNPYSEAGQLEVLDQLINRFGDGKEAFVLGHSAGGNIAAAYAIENQEKLAGAILFAPALLTSGGIPSWLTWMFSIPQLNHLGPLLVSSIASSGTDILYSSYYDPSKVTAQKLSGYTTPLKISGWESAFWEFTKAARPSGAADRLGEITIPTLVIAGDSDEIIPTADSREVAARISGSQLVIIPRTGHLPNEEAPEEFGIAVAEFIAAN